MGFAQWRDQTTKLGRDVGGVQRKEGAPAEKGESPGTANRDQLVVPTVHHDGQ